MFLLLGFFPIGFLLNTSLNYLADTDLLSPKCVCKLTKTTVQAFEDGRLVISFLLHYCLLYGFMGLFYFIYFLDLWWLCWNWRYCSRPRKPMRLLGIPLPIIHKVWFIFAVYIH